VLGVGRRSAYATVDAATARPTHGRRDDRLTGRPGRRDDRLTGRPGRRDDRLTDDRSTSSRTTRTTRRTRRTGRQGDQDDQNDQNDQNDQGDQSNQLTPTTTKPGQSAHGTARISASQLTAQPGRSPQPRARSQGTLRHPLGPRQPAHETTRATGTARATSSHRRAWGDQLTRDEPEQPGLQDGQGNRTIVRTTTSFWAPWRACGAQPLARGVASTLNISTSRDRGFWAV